MWIDYYYYIHHNKQYYDGLLHTTTLNYIFLPFLSCRHVDLELLDGSSGNVYKESVRCCPSPLPTLHSLPLIHN